MIFSTGHQYDREAVDEREIALDERVDTLQQRLDDASELNDMLNAQNVALAQAMGVLRAENNELRLRLASLGVLS